MCSGGLDDSYPLPNYDLCHGAGSSGDRSVGSIPTSGTRKIEGLAPIADPSLFAKFVDCVTPIFYISIKRH